MTDMDLSRVNELDELDRCVTNAQHRIEELWNETNGKCYVSFSGGKDSTVILALIKQCQELGTVGDIPAVFANTGIELGVTYNFVKWCKDNWYSNIEIIRPEKPFSWVIENRGKPLKSKIKAELIKRYHFSEKAVASHDLLVNGITKDGKEMRQARLADKDFHMVHKDFDIIPSAKCCAWMKKKPFKKYAKDNGMLGVMNGVRVGEGGAREFVTKKRVIDGGKLCTYTKDGTIYKLPIIDWSEECVDEFIREYNVPLSEAYTKYGFDRTGCMACPFSLRVANDIEYLYRNEPNRYRAAMFWMKDVYIAQGVKLPFDQDYEREREEVERILHSHEKRNAQKIQTEQQIDYQ